MFVPTSLFPQVVRQALREVSYIPDDIEMVLGNGIRDCYILRRESSRVTRSEFVATVDIKATEKPIVIYVAPEPYKAAINSKLVVEEDPALPTIEYTAKLNQLLIYGSCLNKGKPSTTAKIFVSPINLMLQGIKPIYDLSERDRVILYVFGVMPKSSTKEALARLNVSDKELASLVERGLLEKSGKSFIITTMSKNLRQQNNPVDHIW